MKSEVIVRKKRVYVKPITEKVEYNLTTPQCFTVASVGIIDDCTKFELHYYYKDNDSYQPVNLKDVSQSDLNTYFDRLAEGLIYSKSGHGDNDTYTPVTSSTICLEKDHTGGKDCSSYTANYYLVTRTSTNVFNVVGYSNSSCRN